MSDTDVEPDEQAATDEDGVSDDEASEAEQDDEPDEGDEAAEVAPAEARAPDPESPEDRKRQREAAQAVKSYATKITRLFSEQADFLVGCPLCAESQWPGFVHIGAAGQVPKDVMNATSMFLGYATEVELELDPNTTQCGQCKGLGNVKRPTRVAQYERVQCSRCHGFGFVPPPNVDSNGVIDAAYVPPVEHFDPSGAGVPDIDPTGEPRLLPDGRENPNYGKWPQYKIMVEPWGVTANRTAQDAVS